MKYKEYCLLIFFMGIQLYGQELKNKEKELFFVMPEVLLGKTMEANTGFPETKLQKSFFLSLGNYNRSNNKHWGVGLGYPKTGISFGFTDLGNTEKLGHAYTLIPFVEFGLFKKKTDRWNLNVGFGSSYIDTQFDPDSNPFNKAVTTQINWSFKSFLYYDFFRTGLMDLRLGLGYIHYSNGHTQLPNQGLNSFLLSLSSTIGKEPVISDTKENNQKFEKIRSSQKYLSIRTGIGQNVLSESFNDKKEVYSIAVSAGKIINKTFKFGGGFYYRFYEHYYDYINEDRQLIREQVPFFRDNPYRYATNFGFFASTELFVGHVGIEFDLGLNIHKPFYKIDWQLSQGEFYNNKYFLGELDWYYEVKRTVTSRLGVKYYLINTYKATRNNIFIGANINANLGQADFSELSLGYVYRFNLKEKKKRSF